ncbi:hypothetical protein L596_014870 [Steinernema carpocapsae]|uniref:ATPase AAA-type core domain-containing protein n=1 Tax=Steinernema carpocapsae TaxID=34508 RepID=A0A4U5NE56_STECR|nr:hypothetical protein L596_014870 [Steinernema carpocapsae]
MRAAASKLAIRIDQNQVSFMDLTGVLNANLSADSDLFDAFLKKLELELKNEANNLVIIDDLNTFEAFDNQTWKVRVSRMLLSLKSKMNEESLIVAASFEESLPLRSDFSISLSPVGTGFSKDITEEVVIANCKSIRKSPPTTYHACVRDRSVKLFVPGTVRPLL